MNEEDLLRIRDLEERDREVFYQQRQTFRMLGNFNDALSSAWRFGVIGAFPSVIRMCWLVNSLLLTDLMIGITTAIQGLFLLGPILLAAPVPCAMFAHFWCRRTTFSASHLAAVLVLLVDASIAGWLIYLTRP